jgi:hypothetical protein
LLNHWVRETAVLITDSNFSDEIFYKNRKPILGIGIFVSFDPLHFGKLQGLGQICWKKKTNKQTKNKTKQNKTFNVNNKQLVIIGPYWSNQHTSSDYKVRLYITFINAAVSLTQ